MVKLSRYYLLTGIILAFLLSSCATKGKKSSLEAIKKEKNSKSGCILICNSNKKSTDNKFKRNPTQKVSRIKYWDIPSQIKIPKHPDVEKYVRFFGKDKRAWTERALNRMVLYKPMVLTVLKEYGLPEELAYLPIIESGYNPFATSVSNAVGIWQFIPSTGKYFGLRQTYCFDERRDPYKSTIAAAKYLRYLYQKFGRWDLALAAYNCGEGCVQRRLSSPNDTFWDIQHKLPKQTQEYVPRFYAAVIIAKNPEAFQIHVSDTHGIKFLERVNINGILPLKEVSQITGIQYQLLKVFNAHLKRGKTVSGTKLNLPFPNEYLLTSYHNGKKEKLKRQALYRRVSYRVIYKRYRVKKGDTLYRISKRFGITIKELKRINRLKNNLIKPGMTIKVPVKVKRAC
ncbi:MAG: transglycosylase SLT domain-containing protein [Aquificae bacterium]|nr:transglycosylase SLT domain-containing protein [Aquificota bacterium]